MNDFKISTDTLTFACQGKSVTVQDKHGNLVDYSGEEYMEEIVELQNEFNDDLSEAIDDCDYGMSKHFTKLIGRCELLLTLV